MRTIIGTSALTGELQKLSEYKTAEEINQLFQAITPNDLYALTAALKVNPDNIQIIEKFIEKCHTNEQMIFLLQTWTASCQTEPTGFFFLTQSLFERHTDYALDIARTIEKMAKKCVTPEQIALFVTGFSEAECLMTLIAMQGHIMWNEKIFASLKQMIISLIEKCIDSNLLFLFLNERNVSLDFLIKPLLFSSYPQENILDLLILLIKKCDVSQMDLLLKKLTQKKFSRDSILTKIIFALDKANTKSEAKITDIIELLMERCKRETQTFLSLSTHLIENKNHHPHWITSVNCTAHIAPLLIAIINKSDTDELTALLHRLSQGRMCNAINGLGNASSLYWFAKTAEASDTILKIISDLTIQSKTPEQIVLLLEGLSLKTFVSSGFYADYHSDETELPLLANKTGFFWLIHSFSHSIEKKLLSDVISRIALYACMTVNFLPAFLEAMATLRPNTQSKLFSLIFETLHQTDKTLSAETLRTIKKMLRKPLMAYLNSIHDTDILKSILEKNSLFCDLINCRVDGKVEKLSGTRELLDDRIAAEKNTADSFFSRFFKPNPSSDQGVEMDALVRSKTAIGTASL